MDINLFFDKMVKELNLGNIIEEPLKVTGGLTHRMFKIVTNIPSRLISFLSLITTEPISPILDPST